MTKALKDTNYLTQVRNQYENYPYPPCNPADERQRMVYCPTCSLELINFYQYSGKRDLTRGLRALVAGGGTGSSIIFLAEQLRDMDAELIHLDISTASMDVAKERARIRGLNNITWVHGSLLDAPKLFKEKFDLVESCGVLHHLASPEAGLAALATVLKDDGVMALMLYAPYGREGVYQIQNLMRILNKNEPDMQKRVDHCREVLKQLPPHNAFKFVEKLFLDIEEYGDAGIYDLLLHSHDVAYSLPQIRQFLATANLKLGHLLCLQSPLGNHLYRLESYLREGSLNNAAVSLSLAEKQAAAELMNGKMIKHAFYASRTQHPLPSCADLDNIPFFTMPIRKPEYQQVHQLLTQYQVGQSIRFSMYGREANLTKTAHAESIFKFMDGKRTLKEIFNHIRVEASGPKPSNETLSKEAAAILDAFLVHEWMLLRHKSVPALKTMHEMQQRVSPVNT